MNILMVCLGNICRSPLAEGIMRDKIKKRNMDWTVNSAGTGGWNIGAPPHQLAQKIAKRHGVDISDLSAKAFKKEDILRFDKIYVMDKENYDDVRQICGNLFDKNKVVLLLSVLDNYEYKEIPDPWYANNDAAFEQVYRMVDKACEKIITDYEIKVYNK
jgi:protein-tyrosine phosphatase